MILTSTDNIFVDIVTKSATVTHLNDYSATKIFLILIMKFSRYQIKYRIFKYSSTQVDFVIKFVFRG